MPQQDTSRMSGGAGIKMTVLFILLLLAAAFRLRAADGETREYMSVNMTNSIKGFFLCLVFLAHIQGSADFSHPYLDEPYQFIRRIMGQCIVAMFLFYSGYGVMESVKRKGQSYVKKLPAQRLLKVLLQFDSAVLLFWLYRQLTGKQTGIGKMLLSLIGWDSLGNSNWYIFCILCLYIFTYIALNVFKDNYAKAAFGIFLLSLLYIAVICRAGKDYWWFDTILCYSWGMFFSLYRVKIESFVNESPASWIFFVTVFAAGYLAAYFYKGASFIVYQLWVFCFVAAVVSFTMRFVVDSAPLRWIGIYLFELYILQRLPMNILKPYMLGEGTPPAGKYVYVLVCFGATLIISILYRGTIGRAVSSILKIKSRKKIV